MELWFALVADTGTVIVDAEVTATELGVPVSVEVIVAALVVVGQLTGSAEALRKVDTGLAATVESKPLTCCSSNDSSVFVDLSAVVLADVLVVVHFITGRGLLITLLVLLLLLPL